MDRWFRWLAVLVCLLWFRPAIAAERTPGRSFAPAYRVAGEFEPQAALVLGWDPGSVDVQDVVLHVAQTAWRSVHVAVLVNDEILRDELFELLLEAGVPRDGVHVLTVPSDTVWIRDYGPAVVQGPAGQSILLDAEYQRGDRPTDDFVPKALSRLLQMEVAEVPLQIEGGNVLSNGRGLVLTTTKVSADNAGRGYPLDRVRRVMSQAWGASEIVFLEPLAGESTGHIDMFATFTSPGTVVVGEYPREFDPQNAAILDRNAERLRRLRGPHGPLSVVRIPMPPRDDEAWRTFTNVIYANGTLLMPVYPGFDEGMRDAAVAVYRELLPGWSIAPVDCNGLIGSGGALHCVSLNLSRVPVPFEELPASHGGASSWQPRVVVADAPGERLVSLDRMFGRDEGADDWLRREPPAFERKEHPLNRESDVNDDWESPVTRPEDAGRATWNGYQQSWRPLRDFSPSDRISILEGRRPDARARSRRAP
ncbi:MAG: agmatine deiminase family protein [Planctomycetes bacterium]|nr:agmatine deiminase family protein [Planctomycetota bacterium]